MGKTKLKGGFKSSRQISRLSKVSLSQYKRHSDQKHRKLSFSHDHGDLCCKPGNSDDLDDISPRLSWWQGRRVVELDVLAKALSRCTTCSAPLHLRNCVGEWKRGLGSFLYVRCSNCHENIMVPTGKVSKQIFDMNKKLATATLHSGLGETQVNSFLATLNVPTVSHTMLDKRMKESGGVIHKVADSSLDKSLEEELLQTRDVGDTEITVSVDAGWQKRGSGRSYDSLSGHCSMIGAKTGKILDYTVRSKVCRVCQSAATKSSEPQQHLCSKNWTGSSKGMEPDMVSEMIVKTSAKDVKISTVIGDDDATTMARLRKNVKENILKRSDANHIKKTLGNMLYSLQRKHKSLTSKTIRYIQKNFNYMLAQNKQNPDGISRGLKAMSSHPFGCHSFCEPSWCRFLMAPSAKHKSLPYGKPLSDLSLREDIKGIFESFQIHKVKLSNLGSTQANESFNKTVASKAPKSKHYGGSSSLGFRVAAAVAQKNIGQTYVMNVRHLFK